MAYDAQVSIREGRIGPVYGQVTAPSGGTITIQSGGTFSLYDQTGTIVSGFNAVAVSGYDTGALAAPQIWYILNTTALNPENLTSCVYSGVFTFVGIGSDSINRTFRPDLQISILPVVEIKATYDESGLSTNSVNLLRLYITDVDMTQPVFTDGELSAILNSQSGNVELAASRALTIAATESAYLANTVKIGSFGNGESDVYRALMERAKYYRSIAIVSPVVNPPTQIFQPDYSSPGNPGGAKGTRAPW